MRPLRLEMKGFSAFRETTVVDFDGVDLAALVGPTGAGKSSVLDAIAFALYGAVARYDDRGAIAPVIHQLATEAHVRLDFSVGEERFVAVRIVRRKAKGSGAVTREVRLERVHEGRTDVLAAEGKSMSEAVSKVVGLTFDQFNKTVILPQGEFAAFLHQKGAERQTLLRTLLDLAVYQRMGQAAGDRRAEAHAQAAAAADRLAQLPRPDQIDEAEARHAAFAQLAEVVAGQLDVVGRAQAALAALETRGAELGALHGALSAVVVPEGVAELDARRSEVTDALAAVRSRRDALDAELADLTERIGALPTSDTLRSAVDAHRETADLAGQAEELKASATAAEQARAIADAAAESAAARAAAARDRWEQLDRAAGLGAVRASLEVGQPCPVCERTVEQVPEHDLDEELAHARAEMTTAEAASKKAGKEAQRAATDAALAVEKVDANRRRLDEARRRTHEFPDPDAVTAMLVELDSLAARHSEANRERSALTADERAAERAIETVERIELDARKDLVSARDAVAGRTPPPPGAVSLFTDWTELAAWAASETEAVAGERAAIDAERSSMQAEVDTAMRAVGEACSLAGIDAAGLELPRLHSKIVVTVAKAEEKVEQLRLAAAEREPLEAKAASFERAEVTASALHRHLNATGFERWLLASILTDLVDRAAERLLALSGGRYELRLTDNADFEIVDRHNGDERRSVRSLSGGETFLASLALALALADDIADLAAAGAPRLDSVFLDEGFGTLDAETLETVAEAIDELGASGRMVCIVTHIRELAERMPVRFEVSSGPATSSVERIES